MYNNSSNRSCAAWTRGFVDVLAALTMGLGLIALPVEAAPFAYVANTVDNTVSVIDTATNSVVATVRAGTDRTGIVGTTGAPPATTYTLKELDPLPSGISSSALGINNLGEVVGVSYTASTVSAVIWNGTTPTALGTLPGGTVGAAFGINNLGQVVGIDDSASTGTQATIWNGTSPTALLPVGIFSEAAGINNSGQVAGYTVYNGNYHALFWNSPSATPTMLSEQPWSIAYAINDLGQVAGASTGSTLQATIWTGTTPANLGTPEGFISVGYAINNLGQVAGYTYDGNFSHATVWNGHHPNLHDLPRNTAGLGG